MYSEEKKMQSCYSECGNKLEEKNQFCPNCGKKVSSNQSKKKINKKIFFIIIGIVICICCVGIIYFYITMQDDGLIGYWSFNNGTASDSSGHNHNGNLHGADAVTGVIDQALSFA